MHADTKFLRELQGRLAAARRWDELVGEIRSKPDFEEFLKPPSAEQLLEAASDGPVVVVNVSQWRCDAIIIRPDGVEPVPLPFTFAEAEDRLQRHLRVLAAFEDSADAARAAAARRDADGQDLTLVRAAQRAANVQMEMTLQLDRDLDELLAWLWDAVVEPVLGRLPDIPAQGPLPRVWWCPTGPLGMLPIHAAGRGQDWLMDRVVSSYTPTLRSLLHARRPRQRAADRQLLIASALAGGLGDDTDLLARLERTKVTVLHPQNATVSAVSDALTVSDWVHFHCHADQHLSNPAMGAIQLTDGQLRVFDIAALPLAGECAVLSACKTARGGVNLPDESISIAAALHHAGFRHVIGSLWDLSQDFAAEIFPRLYAPLAMDSQLESSEIPRVLSELIRDIRAHVPTHLWSPLIHIGP